MPGTRHRGVRLTRRARVICARQATPAYAAGPIVINEHVGERLKMFWPEEGGWFDAIISDYNAATDEHCLTYHINSPDETFEWVHLKARAARPDACASRAAASGCTLAVRVEWLGR